MAPYVNFRDLGGAPTPDGRVRSGRLFRSDSLAACDRADVEALIASHGVRTVIDLRREHEVLATPMHRLEEAGVRVDHRSLIDPSVRALTGRDIDTTLAERYQSILASSGDQFVSVIRIIADGSNHPLVFQCAAGKDRTGLVAAVVFQVLGVDDATICADYAKTAEVIDLILAKFAGRTGVAPGPRIMSADAETMQVALDWLRVQHGGAAGYLTTHGLTSDELEAMRVSLVERS
ncbi:MAG: tyrosine-protein phosphatase [Acidimicrobiia bacterium]